MHEIVLADYGLGLNVGSATEVSLRSAVVDAGVERDLRRSSFARVRNKWCSRAPNGADAKLRGRGPRAEVCAARRLPPMTFANRVAICNRRDATALALYKRLQPRTEAGPRQLQRQVRPRWERGRIPAL
jgi:hypothetical protein